MKTLSKFLLSKTALRCTAAAMLTFALAGIATAAPPAGTTIGNQASATYTDDSAVTRTVTSNTVITVVQQVASLTLAAAGTKTANAGGQVVYPHTLTNTGNGTDSFSLSTGNAGTFTFTGAAQLYADANGDGVPDNSTPITSTGELASGAVFKFVAVGTVPNTVTAGNSNTLTVTASSTFAPAVTTTNTDVTTIATQGVINLTQALDVTSGPSPAGPRTITLTYTNTGNTTATALTLTDEIPSGMTYVSNSGRWSVGGSTVLTDTDKTDGQGGIIYDFGVTASGKVTAVISSVPAGQSGTVTFQVNLNSGLAPGARPATALTASYSYNDGVAPVAATDTNTVQYTVMQVASLTVSSDTVATALQGATVSFTNVVKNTGNGTDAFNISLLNSTFPVGTTFQLFRADGLTPLTSTNADGLPDTGPLAANATLNIVVKATLSTTATGGSYSVQVRGTSTFDASKLASGANTLSAISGNSIDLTNTTAGAGSPGVGAGPEVNAVTTNAVSPGASSTFTLVIANNSGAADVFNLSASTDSTFGTLTLPSGWIVVFRDANGALLSNTGVLSAGQTRTVFADVTAPLGTTSGFDLYFRASSPSSGVSDTLHNALSVNTLRNLTLTPNNTGQTVAGGTLVYSHSIINTGTALEGIGSSSVALTAVSSAGFTSVVYWDKDNSGTLDASDPIVTTLADLAGGSNGASTAAGLAPAESARLFVKVTAPPGATAGLTETTTLTATVSGVVNSVAAPAPVTANDITSIIASHLTLAKLQALDANCDGVAEGSFSSSVLSSGAVPGACIRYQITATNAGAGSVLSVLINDATPANTTYHALAAAASSIGTVTAPSNAASGTVQAIVGTLAPGQSAVLSFGVRIDP